MNSTTTALPPSQQMSQMITGFWVAQIVHAAAHYSLADHLQNGGMSPQDFAEAEGLDIAAAERFLRACSSLGLVRFEASVVCGTPLLDTLRAENPHSLRSFALSQVAQGHWLPWGRFVDCLKTGERQTRAALGSDIFEYFAANPKEGAMFTKAMAEFGSAIAPEVAKLLSVAGARTVVDIGGASGSMLFPLLNANPHLDGVVFDLPRVVPSAQNAIHAAGLESRAKAVGGDFFVQVPRADVYLIKHILHDWNDDECVKILSNCRRAANPGARVAIVEMLIGNVNEPSFAPLLDLHMMVMCSGRERTYEEYRDLLVQAGFAGVSVTRTATPASIVVATAC